jgi:hypothetical protein
VQYWIYVYTNIQEFLTVSLPYSFSLTSQAYCDSASKLSGGSGQVINSLRYGTISDVVPACGSASAQQAPGIWYQIQPQASDKAYRLSTGSSRYLDTQISVFRSGDCTALECVAGNNDAKFETSGYSLVEFAGRAGQIYSILVHGRSPDVLGSFVLDIKLSFP